MRSPVSEGGLATYAHASRCADSVEPSSTSAELSRNRLCLWAVSRGVPLVVTDGLQGLASDGQLIASPRVL